MSADNITSKKVKDCLCVLPFIHLHIAQNGELCVCCNSEGTPIRDVDGNVLNIRNNTMAEAWKSPYLQYIRASMLAGICPTHCQGCYNYERNNGNGPRMAVNRNFLGWGKELDLPFALQSDDPEGCFQKEYTHDKLCLQVEKPISFDIRLENICNLRCVMCWPLWSSGVENDPVQARWSGMPNGFERTSTRFGDGKNWINSPILKKELEEYCNEPTDILLAGGEPFLCKPSIEWLKSLIESKQANKVDITIFTNFTKVTAEILDILAQFKSINLVMSIDAAGLVYEYIRYPAKWETITANVRLLKEHAIWKSPKLHAGLNVTLTAYNMLDFQPVGEWAFEEGFDVNVGCASGPTYVCPRIFPYWAIKQTEFQSRRLCELAAEKGRKYSFIDLENEIKAVGQSAGNIGELERFRQYTKDLDQSRTVSVSENCKKLHARWKAHIGEF